MEIEYKGVLLHLSSHVHIGWPWNMPQGEQKLTNNKFLGLYYRTTEKKTAC